LTDRRTQKNLDRQTDTVGLEQTDRLAGLGVRTDDVTQINTDGTRNTNRLTELDKQAERTWSDRHSWAWSNRQSWA
jgi:hypothetical protein